MKQTLIGTIARGLMSAGLMTAGLMTADLLAAEPAQSASQDSIPPVQAPPDMDAPPAKAATPPAKPAVAPAGAAAPIVPLANSDEEARAAAAAEAAATAERAKALDAAIAAPQPASKPLDAPPLPPEVQKAAEATELPVITVRQNGNERIEEYRKKGVLYFVRVQPPEGPPRYYIDNPSNLPPDIRQLSAPSGTVQPVYYKLADWK
jgi:uncharacterized protein DUF2782